MTDIVDFCFRSSRSQADEKDATDGTGQSGTVTEFRLSDMSSSDTLRVGPGGLTGSTPFTPPLDRDWTNQELADLYRVCRLLAMAGLTVDTDRGLSDEGDPWFVFLDQQGEVFVHLCRIDGIYLLDSPAQDAPVQGYRFDDLIREFTERTGAVAAAGHPEGAKVVQLKRHGKVVLHPGAALAALIWTIYLTSDELVLMAPADEADAQVTSPDVPLIDPLSEPDVDAASLPGDFKELFGHDDQAAEFLNTARVERDAILRQSGTEGRDGHLLHMALTNPISAATLGLSALAMAYGVVWKQSFPADQDSAQIAGAATVIEGTAQDVTEKVGDATDATARDASKLFIAPEDAPQEIEARADTVKETGLLTEVVQLVDGAAETLTILLDAADPEDAIAQQEILLIEGGMTAETPASRHDDEKTADAGEPVDGTVRDGTPGALATVGPEMLNSSGLKTLLQTDLRVFSINGNDLAATFDLAALGEGKKHTLLDLVFDTQFEYGYVPETSAEDYGRTNDRTHNGGYAEYDENVQKFFAHLLAKNPDIEVIATANEILFIDIDALEASAEDAYARSWSFDDGGIITTIGLKADFAEFDMIV